MVVKDEAFVGFASGAVYGLTSLVVGHPLDTLKTKMQAQSSHLRGSSFNVFMKTLQKEGIIGLYRGCIPPLLGASVLRSVQFGVFATVFNWMKEINVPKYEFLTVDWRIILSGMASGAARAAVECPLEVAKIRRQIGETWSFSGLYRGLETNMARNVPLLATFFYFLEISKRIDMDPAWRPFISGSVCSTLAWTIVWPFDVIKSQVQGSTEKISLLQRFKNHYHNYGVKGFLRGYGPGATRSLIANGLSMVMYTKTERYLKSSWQ